VGFEPRVPILGVAVVGEDCNSGCEFGTCVFVLADGVFGGFHGGRIFDSHIEDIVKRFLNWGFSVTRTLN